MLTYEGCNYLRQRLILATLSGKSVKIKKIRYKDNNPGLRGKITTRSSIVFQCNDEVIRAIISVISMVQSRA